MLAVDDNDETRKIWKTKIYSYWIVKYNYGAE